MKVHELIELLQKQPPHAKVGAFDPRTGEVQDVQGLTFNAGETELDHYIPDSVVIESGE